MDDDERERRARELGELAATRARVARSRVARAMSTPWRIAMWTLGLATIGAVVAGFWFMGSATPSPIVLIGLFGGALVGLTALGMIAILYPGERADLDREVDETSNTLTTQVQGAKKRLDLATSKGNRGRGPYGAGGEEMKPEDVEALREAVDASLDEIEKTRGNV